MVEHRVFVDGSTRIKFSTPHAIAPQVVVVSDEPQTSPYITNITKDGFTLVLWSTGCGSFVTGRARWSVA